MSFVIPSIFTAIDRYTGPVARMASGTRAFGSALSSANRFMGISGTGIARHERLFRRLTPVISETGKRVLEYAKSAAIAGAIVSTATFSGKSMMEFEDNLNSFRTIVSDLSDKDFAKYRDQVFKVGDDTKKSSVFVAQAFETIAGLNADFAKTATGLGQVSTAAITLAKASKMELQPAAESLVGIMNQFSFGADKADRTINVLAAGQAVGAASISQTAEALKVFGAVAASSNTTIEKSVGLIQVLASKQIQGSQAGTALRGVFVRLQKAGLGYKSGQFQINDALSEAQKAVNKLRKEKEKDAYITDLFGMENLTAGKILMANVGKLNAFTAAVTGTTEAQKAAEINTNSLSNRWEELKAKWVNIITSGNGTTSALEKVKQGVIFLTNHMSQILDVGVKVLTFMVVWKGLIMGAKAALFAYNVVLGINAALNTRSAIAIGSNTIALTAYNVATKVAQIATKVWTAAQWLLNVAMDANPIGVIIMIIGLLVAAIMWVASKTTGWGEQWDATMSWIGSIFKGLYLTLKLQFLMLLSAFQGMVDGIVKAWYWAQNKIGSLSDEQYKKNLAQIEAEKNARLMAIRDTAAEMAKESQKILAGPGWHVKWKSDEAQTSSGETIPVKAINPKLAEQQFQAQFMNKGGDLKSAVEILVKGDSDKVEVGKTKGNVKVKTSSTLPAYKNKN